MREAVRQQQVGMCLLRTPSFRRRPEYRHTFPKIWCIERKANSLGSDFRRNDAQDVSMVQRHAQIRDLNAIVRGQPMAVTHRAGSDSVKTWGR